MRRWALLLALLVALPAAAQEEKPARKRNVPLAHTKPTPQQIREFDKLEKEEERQEIRGRSPNSGSKAVRAPSPPKAVRAPSPK